jgi:hypothetical protein
VSYDFTLPNESLPLIRNKRIGVPITNMSKEVLKNLSVTDADGKALSVWGSELNGQVGVEAIQALMFGCIKRKLTPDETKVVRQIVFSDGIEDVTSSVAELMSILKKESSETDIYVIESIIQEFAKTFIFIVEVPVDYRGVRNLIKVSYDMDMGNEIEGLAKGSRISQSFGVRTKRLWDRAKKYRRNIMRRKFSVGSTYLPPSSSCHLEINAPDGLQVTSLQRHSVDAEGRLGEVKEASVALGHIAHIHFRNTAVAGIDGFRSVVEFAPVLSGLVLQTWIGTILAALTLLLEWLGIHRLYQIIPHIGDAGPLAGVYLALPAFLLSLLARSREHNHVKEVLRLPRVVASLSACVLLISAASLVLGLTKTVFLVTLIALFALQTGLMLLMSLGVYSIHQSDKANR